MTSLVAIVRCYKSHLIYTYPRTDQCPALIRPFIITAAVAAAVSD